MRDIAGNFRICQEIEVSLSLLLQATLRAHSGHHGTHRAWTRGLRRCAQRAICTGDPVSGGAEIVLATRSG